MRKLVDLIGITSIMEVCFFSIFVHHSLYSDTANGFLVEQVLIRLIGSDEHVYANCLDSMKWLEDTDVLEMIVDKFSSSVSCISTIF